jgi:ferritin-like metal-binding protein YciE
MRKRTPKKSTTGRATRPQASETESSHTELHQLFLDELADIYNAEQQLVKALPKMAEAADSDELREAFESHLQETKNQISRIEQAVESLGESLPRKKCKGMEGLLEEAREIMEEKEDSAALDAALIAEAQKAEHYEIAVYGTLCTWAELMGHDEALQLLKESLNEEEMADKKLTDIAETVANLEAEEQEQD